MFDKIITFIREYYGGDSTIPLHVPVFAGNEKKYLCHCLESTYVSSVGEYVDEFEKQVADFIGSRFAVAVVNGTQALFVALKLVDATRDTEVLTQSLTFVATANAITYTGAVPVFIDVDRDTMGMSPRSLREFLTKNTCRKKGRTYNRATGREIVACLPMHTLGHSCRIDEIVSLGAQYHIPVIEDAAESLGSLYKGRHTGTFGQMGVFSFNGNKIITTGGGGMLVTDVEGLARQAKHLTTTARISHGWEVSHDQVGYNFRLPNINAALGVAQMEVLPGFLEKKRELAGDYGRFFESIGMAFVKEPARSRSNYWLNGLVLKDFEEREAFLEYTNGCGVLTRALWRPMHLLPMYRHCQTGRLDNTQDLYERLVSIPSSVRT